MFIARRACGSRVGMLTRADDLENYSPVLDGFKDEEHQKLDEFAELAIREVTFAFLIEG